MKANHQRKRKKVSVQAPHRFEIPSAAQLERCYGADVVSAITKIREEYDGTTIAAIQEAMDALLQEAKEGNLMAAEMLRYLCLDIEEILRILQSNMDEETKTLILDAHHCGTKAFLNSLDSD
jgi:phosphoribosyl-ATP pyrophosphohydrolase